MCYAVSIAAVGDVMLGDSFYFIGNGVRSQIEKEKGFIWGEVRNILNKFDLVIGNLECVLSDVGLNKKRMSSLQYRGKNEFAKLLVDANFSVMSVANNHIMEHGTKAMLDTVSCLESLGIMAVGLPHIQHRLEPHRHIRNLKDVSIAFLAYCLNLERFTKSIVPDLSDVLADVEFFKSITDKIIISLHWGMEYMSIPSPKQIQIAHKLVDSGADIILGHHPHVLQGIEIYNEKIIAYSLGNFVFNNWLDECRDSIILKIILSKEGSLTFDIIPIWINYNHQPVPATGEKEENIKKKILQRNLDIENNPILINHDEDEYFVLVNKELNMYRKKLHKFIFKQLPKLSINIAIQIMAKPIIGRLNKLIGKK